MDLAPRARLILQMITEATAPDPLTVKLTLSQPFEPFLLMFDVTACVIVSKKIYDGTDYRSAPANQHPIGTGPFQFAEWQRGNFIRLTRYAKYWKPDEPYLDEIIYHYHSGQSEPVARAGNRQGAVGGCQRYRAVRCAAIPSEAEPDGEHGGVGAVFAAVLDRAEPSGEAAGRCAGAAGDEPRDRPRFPGAEAVVRVGQAGDRAGGDHHAVLRSGAEAVSA